MIETNWWISIALATIGLIMFFWPEKDAKNGLGSNSRR